MEKKLYLVILIISILLVAALYQSSFAATLRWDANPEAVTYSVYVRDAGQSETDFRPLREGLTETSLPIAPTQFNHTYEYAIRAVNQCGVMSDLSAIVPYNDCEAQVIQTVTGVRIIIDVKVGPVP